MKIIIIGAGEIGYDLASVLSKEKHDVIILDRDKESLSKASESLDVLCKEGNATSANDLNKAGVSEADIVISVTSVDEVNMIASMISKKLGAKMVIARVRNDEFSHRDSPLKATDLGIDVMINPELSAAQEIAQLLKRSAASDVINLADDLMQLVGIRLDRNAPLIGKTLIEYASENEDITFRVVAIARRGRTLMPRGPMKLQTFDQIFILAKTEDIPAIINTTGKSETDLNRIMIAGGSGIGTTIARILCGDEKKDWSVKLIEPDYERAEELAIELKNAMILNGNPTDPDLLASEGITDMDAFIAVTDDEESNIISCLMAKHLDVNGVVFGLLTPDGSVDMEQTEQLTEQARPMSATFHRAFDMARDPTRSLETLIELGIDRVLTSGHEAFASEGIDLLRELVAQAGDRIVVIPGGGIDEQSLPRILNTTGAREIHVTGTKGVESGMTYRNPRCFMGIEPGLSEFSTTMTDVNRIRALVQLTQ